MRRTKRPNITQMLTITVQKRYCVPSEVGDGSTTIIQGHWVIRPKCTRRILCAADTRDVFAVAKFLFVLFNFVRSPCNVLLDSCPISFLLTPYTPVHYALS